MPNEDAWVGGSRAYGTFIAVCDGLGSKPLGGWGATQACLATRDAIRYWHSLGNTSANTLLKLIELFWKTRIEPNAPSDCATTCLFAVTLPSGRLIAAGNGDGLIAVRKQDGDVDFVLGRHITGFSNQTTALGSRFQADDWRLGILDSFEPGMALLLASDGIADDLLEERVGEFIFWLVREYAELPATARHNKLVRDLKNWPTPRHVDDKTLAVMYR